MSTTHSDAPPAAGAPHGTRPHGHRQGDGSRPAAPHGPKHYTQQLLPPWDELPGRSAPPAAPPAGAKTGAEAGAGDGAGAGAGEGDGAGGETATRARGRVLSGIHHSFNGGASPAPATPAAAAAAAAAHGDGTLAGLFSLPSSGSCALGPKAAGAAGAGLFSLPSTGSRTLGVPLPGVAELPLPPSTAPQRPGLTRQG